MELKFITKRKDVVEIELNDKVLPNALVAVLIKKGIE